MKLEDLKDINIEQVAKAIEIDAGETLPEIREALTEVKTGKHGVVHTPDQMAIRQARKQLGLSQPAFADMLHTSVATLRDWEQGRFNPPGSAVLLAQIAVDHPEVIAEYQVA